MKASIAQRQKQLPDQNNLAGGAMQTTEKSRVSQMPKGDSVAFHGKEHQFKKSLNRSQKINVTLLTAKEPKNISKNFYKDDNSELIKKSGGKVYRGTCQAHTFDGPEDLKSFLDGLGPNQAVIYGQSKYAKALIVPDKLVEQTRKNGFEIPVISRTKENFDYPDGPAGFSIDNDSGLAADELIALLYEIVPETRNCVFFMRPSTSSNIYDGGKQLRGETGQRIILIVLDGRDIPRTMKVLSDRLWAADKGYIKLSISGARLIRNMLCDTSMSQSNRIDFVGGAHCVFPISQRLPEWKIINPNSGYLDTKQALPDDRQMTVKAQALIKAAKQALAPEVAATQKQWVEERVDVFKNKNPDATTAEIRKARKVYARAIESGVLLGDFPIILDDGQTVTVAELLEDPDRYHHRCCCDPLEPEYRNDTRIGYIVLKTKSRPYIISHAHGGRRFYLTKARVKVRIIAGEMSRTVDECYRALASCRQFYKREEELVFVDNSGKIHPLRTDGVQVCLDGLIHFERYDKREKKNVPKDCPPNVARSVMAKGPWNQELFELGGVSTNPVYDPVLDRLIDEDGYDPATRILLILNDLLDWPSVKTNPSLDDARIALRTLWFPFKDFPFASELDIGVWLATVLTAAVRQVLPTAPATATNSPTAGSGKTKLAECASVLAGQHNPIVMPVSGDSEEVKKALFASARQGHSAVILDNINGRLKSDALCVYLTSPYTSDRILGQSETSTVRNNMVVLLTGNNIQLVGDLCRRVLRVTIDPKMDRPWRRSFDLEPVSYCRDHRLEMLGASYTLLRSARQAGAICPDKTASFEDWSDTVRATVLWCRDKLWDKVADPIESIDMSYSIDPDTEKLKFLLHTWFRKYGTSNQTINQVVKDVNAMSDFGNPDNLEFFDAVNLVGTIRGHLEARILGAWIAGREGRIVDGLKFVRDGVTNKRTRWAVSADFKN